MKLRVLIADDHAPTRASVRSILEDDDRFDVCAEAPDAPNAVLARIAATGTPRVSSREKAAGASARRASAMSMREEAKSPEFSAESTAVSTTTLISVGAAGICSASMTLT